MKKDFSTIYAFKLLQELLIAIKLFLVTSVKYTTFFVGS